MNPIEFITPNGHKVYIKPRLTFGEIRALERIQVSRYELDPVTKKIAYNGSSVYDAEDYAFKCLVTKIIDKEGKEFTNDLLLVVNTWEKDDGDFVYKKINEATRGSTLSQDSKKK
jgi:hypothetical protein